MSQEFELLPECPFWEEFRTKEVRCEGLDVHSATVLRFNKPRFLDKHKRTFCCSMAYESCPVARMLFAKYGM